MIYELFVGNYIKTSLHLILFSVNGSRWTAMLCACYFRYFSTLFIIGRNSTCFQLFTHVSGKIRRKVIQRPPFQAYQETEPCLMKYIDDCIVLRDISSKEVPTNIINKSNLSVFQLNR